MILIRGLFLYFWKSQTLSQIWFPLFEFWFFSPGELVNIDCPRMKKKNQGLDHWLCSFTIKLIIIVITEHVHSWHLSLLPETRVSFPLRVKAVTLPLCSSKELCWTTCQESNPFHANSVPTSATSVLPCCWTSLDPGLMKNIPSLFSFLSRIVRECQR